MKDTLVGILQKSYELKRHLAEKTFTQAGDMRREADFLRKLIEAKENRCDRLVRLEQKRLSAAEWASPELQQEAAKWLRRVEMIQVAFDRLLESYGVTQYVSSGSALAERDDVKDSRREPGAAPGAIVEVLQAGYLWRGQVLRPAQVIIAE